MKCSFVNLFEVQLRSGGIKLCYTHLVALLCPNTFGIKIAVDVPLLLCSHCHSVDDSVCVCVGGGVFKINYESNLCPHETPGPSFTKDF